MQQSQSLLNKFFIGYTIIQPTLFGLGFLKFDGAGHIYMLMTAIILLLNYSNWNFWNLFRIPAVKLWTVWCLYVAIAWILMDSNGRGTELQPHVFLFNYVFKPLVALILCVYEGRRNTRSFVRFLFICFTISIIFGLLFQRDASPAGERGGELLGNNLPLEAVCYLAIASFGYINGWLKGKYYVVVILLVTASVLMVATRKAFMAELIILLFTAGSKFKLNSAKNFLLLLSTLLIAYFACSYIIDNTVLGERMNSIEESGEKYNTSDIAFLNFLGDRAFFYIVGWGLFLKFPITGIGLFNFAKVTGTSFPIHSEYIVQLCETGLIGFTLYVLYVLSLFKSIRAIRKFDGKSNARLFYGWMAALLFISLTAWTYQFPRYFIVTGLMVGFCEAVKNRRNNPKKQIQ